MGTPKNIPKNNEKRNLAFFSKVGKKSEKNRHSAFYWNLYKTDTPKLYVNATLITQKTFNLASPSVPRGKQK